MSTESSFVPGLSDPRLTQYYDPVLKWFFWENFFRIPLVEAVNAQPNQIVLDVGCGTGTLTLALKNAYPATAVIGLDMDDNLNNRLPGMLSTAGFAGIEAVWRAFDGLLTLYGAQG